MPTQHDFKYKYIDESTIDLENYTGVIYISFFPNGLIYVGHTTKIPFTQEYDDYFGSGKSDKFRQAEKEHKGNGLYKLVIKVIYNHDSHNPVNLLRKFEVAYQLLTDCTNELIGYNKAIGDPSMGFTANPAKIPEIKEKIIEASKKRAVSLEGKRTLEKMHKAVGTPEARKKNSENKKKLYGTEGGKQHLEEMWKKAKAPEAIDKMSDSLKIRFQTEEGKDHIRKAHQAQKTPEAIRKAEEGRERRLKTEEGKEHMNKMTAAAHTEEAIRKSNETKKNRPRTEKELEAARIRKEAVGTPEGRKKNSDAQKAAWARKKAENKIKRK